MLQVGQLVQLGANLLGGPSFLGKGQISSDTGTRLDEFVFHILNCAGHLFVNLTTDSGEAQEDGVAVETDGGVDISETADEAITTKRVERFADVTEDEKEEDNVPEPDPSSIDVREGPNDG